jgi:hypothetical protein
MQCCKPSRKRLKLHQTHSLSCSSANEMLKQQQSSRQQGHTTHKHDRHCSSSQKTQKPWCCQRACCAAKFAKLASLASVLDIPSPVDNIPVPERAWLHTCLTHEHLLEMSEEDKRSLHVSWRRLQFVACTEPKGRVLKNAHLMLAMDIGKLEHLFQNGMT